MPKDRPSVWHVRENRDDSWLFVSRTLTLPMTDSQHSHIVDRDTIGMQLNSTFIPVDEMDQQHRSQSSATAAVHRYVTPPSAPHSTPPRQGLNAPDLVRLTNPPLPMRLSEARLLLESQSESPRSIGGRRNRTGLRSNQARSRINQNDYVEEPVLAIINHDRSDNGKSSSSAPTSSPHPTESKSKDKSDGTVVVSSSSCDGEPCKESIFCPRCQRCRCVKCQQSRRLPSLRCGPQTTMLQCLPEQVIDCCSCLSCARAAYRRCSIDADDQPESSSLSLSVEELCACSGRSCCRRWTVLAALAPCLPCLCLYWPMRCLLSACSACYNCRRRRGCQCTDDDGQGGGGTLLLSSDELHSSNSSSSA